MKMKRQKSTKKKKGVVFREGADSLRKIKERIDKGMATAEEKKRYKELMELTKKTLTQQ